MTNMLQYPASLQAPQEIFATREAPPGATIKHPDFWERYDDTTLIYDAVWLPHQQRVRLFMPKLFNFQKQFMQCAFSLDGTRVNPKLRPSRRFDMVDLPWSGPAPSVLRLSLGDWEQTLRVTPANPQLFAGRNVLYTMLRNDDLTWVADWVRAHQRNHGADAVLIANNGSTAYSANELLQTIANVPGINSAHVLEMPFRHSPAPSAISHVGLTEFLQHSCLNLVRDRFFAQARAVLVCDIDELVTGPSGHSIFDATATSFLRYKHFHGSWRFAAPEDRLLTHADHVYVDHASRPCRTKYCIVPSSTAGRMIWGIHGLENVNRYLFRPQNPFHFMHCHSISTSWKVRRDQAPLPEGATPDQATQDYMQRSFGG